MSEPFRIFETDQYLKDLTALRLSEGSARYRKITGMVYEQLRENPYFGRNIKKLRNWKPETWRYRIGNYRLFYVIDDTVRIVSIVSLEPRSSAYT
ncbi:MAG: type II toxin-antitoxin system RelE/ParE family toxin [Spirochaetaceae bacterium]|nr:MAG: type II toxin-antitoxin system RelE/ParE family toxin [Spirochaetaceae bacterium]